jgi:hypothetical protein
MLDEVDGTLGREATAVRPDGEDDGIKAWVVLAAVAAKNRDATAAGENFMICFLFVDCYESIDAVLCFAFGGFQIYEVNPTWVKSYPTCWKIHTIHPKISMEARGTNSLILQRLDTIAIILLPLRVAESTRVDPWSSWGSSTCQQGTVVVDFALVVVEDVVMSIPPSDVADFMRENSKNIGNNSWRTIILSWISGKTKNSSCF